MDERRIPIRIVVPVWGQAYIDVMTRAMIPALLAPGNIPAVSNDVKIEFIFITEKSSQYKIANDPAIKYLGMYASLKFMYIDNFKSTNYGVVLTKAYFKSVIDFQEGALDSYYFFFNVDTVISNGSLSTVVSQIKNGKTLIFSPGIRVNSDDFFKDIEKFRTPNDISLSIGARELARITLKNLHKTVLAQRRTHRFLKILRPYQFYWQERKEVLHVSAFIMANICFRPTKIPSEPFCFIDYCISEAFCPGHDITILADSDEFLLVEPQREGWMLDEVSPGDFTEREYVEHFSAWVTPQHVALGQTIYTVHSVDLTDSDRRLIADAGAWAKLFASQLSTQPYAGHPYWRWATAAEKRERAIAKRKKENALERVSEERPVVRVDSLNDEKRRLHRYFEGVFGRYPHVRFFHPSRVQIQPALDFLSANVERRKVVILCGDSGTWYLPERDPKRVVFRVWNTETLLHPKMTDRNPTYGEMMNALRHAECVFFRPDGKDILLNREIVRFFAAHVPADCRIGIHYSGLLVAFLLTTKSELLAPVFENDEMTGGIVFSGTLASVAALLSLAGLAHILSGSKARRSIFNSVVRFPLLLGACAISLGATAMFNVMRSHLIRPRPFVGAQAAFLDLKSVSRTEDDNS